LKNIIKDFEKTTMDNNERNARREFLKKIIATQFEPLSADELLAIEDKVKPYYEHLQFFKGLSDWPVDW